MIFNSYVGLPEGIYPAKKHPFLYAAMGLGIQSAPNLWIFDSRIQMWSEEAESQPWLTLLWDVQMRVNQWV